MIIQCERETLFINLSVAQEVIDAAADNRNRNSLMKYSETCVKEMYCTGNLSYSMRSPVSQWWLEIHDTCFVQVASSLVMWISPWEILLSMVCCGRLQGGALSLPL